MHVSVLQQEVVAWFADAPPGWLVDCTLGGGGHADAVLSACPQLRVLGLDRDPAAIAEATRRLAGHGDRAVVQHVSFGRIAEVVDARSIGPLSGILADVGVSSHHLDTADRGFSFSKEGPLDMRMDPSSGRTLAEKLAATSEQELADVLFHYGDIRASRRAAAAVLKAFRDGAMTTTELAERIRGGMPRAGKLHPATLVFQALRIWVNDELGQLAQLLADGPELLADGGVMAVIAFHSGEDRLVKQRFRELGQGRWAPFSRLSRKPVSAKDAEIRGNPRARSARLRGLVRRSRGEAKAGWRGDEQRSD